MEIRKVRSNVKKGCDVELGSKTLIVGPNGAGKSSIVNAVELALTGRASDIAGRVDIAREADVMSLAKDGAPMLEAVAAFDDGVNAAYYTTGSTAKAKKATGDKPADRCHDDVLPIRSLKEAVLGSPQTARKYLLAKASGDMTLDDIRALVPADLRAVLDAVLAQFSPSMLPADALISALEQSGANMREANAKVKAAKSAASLVTDGASAPPTETELKAAKKARDEARKQLAAITAATTAFTGLDGLRQEAGDRETEALRAIEALKAAEAAFANIEKPSPTLDGLSHVVEACALSTKGGECMVCGSTDNLASIDERRGMIVDHLANVERGLKDYRRAEDKVKELRTKADVAVLAAERAAEAFARAEATVDADTQPDVTVEDAKQQLDAAEEALLTLQTRANAWDTARKAQATANDAERQSAEWSKLKDALELAVAALLTQALSSFIDKVQRKLPKGDVFDLRLRDGDREVVQFGLVRDGYLHTALSGAEWARVVAAMASACVPDGKYACVIPEERAFDAVTLGDVMRALGSSPHQVILTSPVTPHAPPKGWTIIERSR